MHAPLRGRVSSDVEELQRLHDSGYPWLPDAASVRPPPAARREKQQLLDNAVRRYDSTRSYVLHRIFRLACESRGAFEAPVLFVSEATEAAARRPAGSADDVPRLTRFVPNAFPYTLCPDTRHYVLWFLLDHGEDEAAAAAALTDGVVNGTLRAELDALQPDGAYDFVWYRNPKPSVVDGVTYHVQVFWTVTGAPALPMH